MALGSLALQDEEEALLARQILYAVLTALSAVLRDLYIRDREAGMQPGLSLLLLHHGENGTGNGNGNGNGTLYGREGDGAANRCLSRVLALLGKVVPE
ncbi:hypothetical protein BJX61DRAFT_527147 [Aspergillus egyptiacus]|nr:hypothetical protein BJX61DRAFT_527147 [Aspergillus egyptiacus]